MYLFEMKLQKDWVVMIRPENYLNVWSYRIGLNRENSLRLLGLMRLFIGSWYEQGFWKEIIDLSLRSQVVFYV